MKKDFHQLALHSALFKGRSDWYFCYLKSEKIAHVLCILLESTDSPTSADFEELVENSSSLPSRILYAAAGEVEAAAVLASVFSLLSSVRILVTRGFISKETGAILIQEYENIVAKLVEKTHPSPFVQAEDFTIPEVFYRRDVALSAPQFSSLLGPTSFVKDTHKGHQEKRDSRFSPKENVPGDRASLILEIIKKNNGVSIKDIGVVVRNCSAKTIQRELGVLIEKGLVRREGERRWSLYFSTSTA